MFNFLKGQKRIRGRIGYFGLEDWWLSEFSDTERQYMQVKFQPLGASGDSLTEDEISYTSETPVGFLHAFAGWFSKDEDRHLAHKILRKAEELVGNDTRVLDAHFLFGEKINILYKDRAKPGCLDKAIEACKQQIAIGLEAADAFKKEYKGPLPSHKGYEQLAIILEKQKKFEEVIKLCNQAASQGWAGDWEKRVERCEKKGG